MHACTKKAKVKNRARRNIVNRLISGDEKKIKEKKRKMGDAATSSNLETMQKRNRSKS